MKVAVTGAGGFVGRHAVSALRRLGVDLVACSRSERASEDGLTWRRLDLREDPTGVFQRLGRPDSVLHLAWGGLPHYESAHHVEEELPMQERFLDALAREGLPHLVVAGTCLEYGLRSGELTEEHEPAPTTNYARAKDAVRRGVERLRDAHGLGFVWARLFYLHGPGQGPSSLRGQLLEALARGDATFGMSPGEQLRDYLPVERAADSLARLALSRVDAGVVNVCSGVPVRVRELVEGWLAGDPRGIALDLGRHPYAAHEPFEFWGSRRKLDRVLGS